ncbi:miraculin-like [Solanum stenotomum]|uniref:miraculin-like n=1 Tax=Solanum stenotomum TaxID=172797 RepID=UPI0020D010F3|nr:miraculin-like [Solanum stenotomum]
MKSINILSFLLVSTTLSLVAFSHEFSISDNNGNVVSPPVLHMDGEPLKIDEEYSIITGDYMLGPPPRFVITGGTLGIPGPNTLKNWFKIVKYETGRPNSYKLTYCPSKYMCPTCQFDCADVGLYEDRGYTRLALNNMPYPFGFSKVNKNDA